MFPKWIPPLHVLSCVRFIFSCQLRLCIYHSRKIEWEDDEIDIPIYDYRINSKLKYDVKRNRLLLGDININEIIRFGNGQYASFKDNKLIGVIVDFTKNCFSEQTVKN